jgi:hypothetical protein
MAKPKKIWETWSFRIGIIPIIMILTILIWLFIYPPDPIREYTWLLAAVILAGCIIATILMALQEISLSEEEDGSDICSCSVLMILIAMTAIVFALVLYAFGKGLLIIAIAGIVGLSVPLVLAVTSKNNFGSKLDSGEIRRSIVISLTIVYIILLVVSFASTYNQGDNASKTSNATFSSASFDVTKFSNSTAKEHITYTVNLTGASGGIFEMKNASGCTFQFTPQQNSSSGGLVNLGGNTSDGNVMIPESALGDFSKNFLYVYVIIILFYFGSRAWENNKTDNQVKSYLYEYLKSTKGSTPPKAEEIAELRYTLGDIGSREYSVMMEKLMPTGIKIKNVKFEDKKALIRLSNENKKADVIVTNIEITKEDDGRVVSNLEKTEATIHAGEEKEINVNTEQLASDSKFRIKVTTTAIGFTYEGTFDGPRAPENIS